MLECQQEYEIMQRPNQARRSDEQRETAKGFKNTDNTSTNQTDPNPVSEQENRVSDQQGIVAQNETSAQSWINEALAGIDEASTMASEAVGKDVRAGLRNRLIIETRNKSAQAKARETQAFLEEDLSLLTNALDGKHLNKMKEIEAIEVKEVKGIEGYTRPTLKLSGRPSTSSEIDALLLEGGE